MGKGADELHNQRSSLFLASWVFLKRGMDRSYGGAAMQGTGRTNMEDTYSIVVDPNGKEPAFFGVYDGHGGNAVSE